MNPDQIVALGTYCEALMRDDTFNMLCELRKQTLVQGMIGTQPHEAKRREGIYAEVWGLLNFLAMMKGFVDARDAILAEANEQLEEQDFE